MTVPLQSKTAANLARQTARLSFDAAYRLSRIKKLPGLANGMTSILQRNAYLQGKVAKPVQAFLEKIPGKGDVAKGGAAGATLGAFIAIGGVAIVVAIQAILQNIINSANFKNFEYLNSEIQKSFDRWQKNVIAIRAVEAQQREFKQQDQRTRDRIYSLEKQQPKIREDANNALYEVRQGRKIIDSQLIKYANDINALKSQFDRALGGINNNFQKTIETTIANLQQSLQRANNQIEKANFDIQTANRKIDTQNSVIQAARNLPVATARAITTVQVAVTKAINDNGRALQQTARRWGVTVTPATVTPATVTPSENSGLTVTSATVTPATVTYSDFSTSDIALQLKVDQERQQASLKSQLTTLGSAVVNVGTVANNAQSTANLALKKTGTPIVDLSPLQKEINANKTALTQLNTKIKERENVDTQSNRKLDELKSKLDQMIPLLGLIPGRAGQDAANRITPNIPTPDKIESAVGNAICKSLNSGCGKASVDDAVGRVNTNNNNNTGAVLDAVNTVANGALLQGQQTILQRLGDQLPGGIGGKLTRLSKWLHLDRALNILIWWQTLHNAYMLSANLGQTLTSMISNVLAAVGIKDAEGSPLDIGEILGNQFDNLAKSVVGVDEWNGIKSEWKKWNRIYQAAANLMNSIQSIGYSILSALEVIGNWIASIGNALRKWGEVGESAYKWMNPTPNFQNKFFTTLENVENVVSQVDQVASEVLSIQETIGQIGQQKDEVFKSLQQNDDSKQSTPPPEATKVKGAEDESKRVSATGLAIGDNDKEADE